MYNICLDFYVDFVHKKNKVVKDFKKIVFISTISIISMLVSSIFATIYEFTSDASFLCAAIISGVLFLIYTSGLLYSVKRTKKNDKNDKKDEIFEDRLNSLIKILDDNHLYSKEGIDYLLFYSEKEKKETQLNPTKISYLFISCFLAPFIISIFSNFIDKMNKSGVINNTSIQSVLQIVCVICVCFSFVLGTAALFDLIYNKRYIREKFENDLRYLKTQIIFRDL